MPSNLLASLPLLALCTACTVYEREHYVGRERVELARVTRPDRSTESYVLEVGPMGGEASLTVITEYDRNRAFLGLKVKQLDGDKAKERGVEPFRGLLVTGTWPRSAAEAAGILAGDVVLSVAGNAVVYDSQLPQVEAGLSADTAVPVRVLRGQKELEIEVTPRALRDRVVDPQPIDLEHTTSRRPYAGVVLRGIPRTWSERMFGDDRNAVLFTGVEVGSPAWVAGFRGGDVLEAVDGQPVPTLDELSELVHARGATGGDVTLRVRRGRDDLFEATVALEDYRATKQVWFPLLFHVRDGAREDHWTVGPFGLIAGNRSTYVDDPPTRTAEVQNNFDALLGLVHVESGPRSSTLRLLWFIRIDL